MKRCPRCRRDYFDDSLLFCLDDGERLLEGPASVDEPVTAIISPHETEPTTRVFDRPAAGASEPAKALTTASARNSLFAGALGVLLVTALGVGGYLYYRRSSTTQIGSIAVVPFLNESGNADLEYLSDGMTETLISGLTKLPGLDVKPRSTVFRYKGKELDPRSVGKELNVQAVLSGRVVQRGQDITLFVELIDISQDKAIWSETYNRKQTDLVSLQSDIARDVSSKIKTKLSGQDVARVTKTYTADPEAYQLYLKGNFYMGKYNEEGYRKALEYYNQAVERDPNYPLPYQGIALAYDFANDWYLPPREAEPKAKAAAMKALELDETLAETHYLLGKIIFWYEWDWAKAESEWKRANELDPAFPARFPLYLAATGRYDEAIQGQQQVLQRTPLDLLAHLDMAGILLSAGMPDRSIEQSRKAMEIDPDYWWSYQNLGLSYGRKKQYPEAIAALERARLTDPNPAILGYLGYVYAAAGKKTEAQKVLDELKELSSRRYVSPYYVACIYAGLDNKDQAFAWLERAFEERASFLTLLRFDTVLENLRGDPRYKDLLRRMNLPE